MIELTSPAEIIALKLEWEKRYGQRCTTPQGYVKKVSRGGQRYYVRGPSEYKEEVKMARERVHEDYKQSEENRKAKRGLSSGERMTQKAKEREEDKRWEEKFKKHEDPNYYGVRV